LWNDAISSLSCFSNLTKINGGLSLYGFDALQNLEGLENVTSIEGGLAIGTTKALTDISSLSNVQSIFGTLYITSNESLSSLEGLEHIAAGSIQNYMRIEANPLLSECEIQSICAYLADPNGEIIILNNATGCNDQQEVEEGCSSFFQPCLPEGITFSSQSEIDKFELNNPGCTGIIGDMIVSGPDITNLSFLSTLNSIGGNLIIMDRDHLKDLSGLENITSIGGDLIIGDQAVRSNSSLQSLEGLVNLASINGDLIIQNNPALSSLEGIHNIDPLSIQKILIRNNSSLSTCAVESICEYIITQGGEIEISDNKTGCNGESEVREICTLGINDEKPETLFDVYPNPAKTELFISNKGNLIISEVNIYNQHGQKVLHQERFNRRLSISELSRGMHVIEIITPASNYRMKILLK
jgi:hypothetical protein